MAGEFATQIDLVGELACHFNTILHNHLRLSKGEFATSPRSRRHVNATTTNSRAGEASPADGVHFSGPHHIDVEWLYHAYQRTRKDGAVGVDGQTAEDYQQDLLGNLQSLLERWIVEVDIRKFYDTLDHAHLRDLQKLRVRDGVLLRLIGKWLNAGVLEDGSITLPETGTPQGGVISPLLANVYLHYVLDVWFEREVKPRLCGPRLPDPLRGRLRHGLCL